MAHFRKLEDVQLDGASLVTIGVYDGVHRGHQRLLADLVAQAHHVGQRAVVISFFPHPDVVLRGVVGRYYLTTPDERATLLEQLGVDVVITLAFDERLRQMRAAAFVDQLVARLGMRQLWVGADFALGYQREGNVAYLSALGEARGYQVQPVELVTYSDAGAVISSTSIRELLLQGRVELAREWLGRSYSLSGEVVHGDKRGRLIGFPTANLAVWDELVIPLNGVYAGWATVRGKRYAAVTNIGTRPTFDGVAIRVEPHLLDFDADIYGETLTVTFEHRLRAEQKFSGIDALRAQLALDVAAARSVLGV
ncbi:MAG: bifunctional riboflavin kinase/FAD synthetase [Anaerolineae bacterium]